MAQLLKHYFVDRDNTTVFATTTEQYSAPRFGTILPAIEGLQVLHSVTDENGVPFCLSECSDAVTIEEVPGLEVLTQAEFDQEIGAYDSRQELKRWSFIRKHRDRLLENTDWIVIKSQETGVAMAQDFLEWRQALRDLPQAKNLPIELPVAPVGVPTDAQIYEDYISDLRTVPMINDPIPAPQNLFDSGLGNS
jgi:hypothetical protein